MRIQNEVKQFSGLTKALHWLIFILFTIQYFLVYRREYFPKDAPEKLQYILLHKSIGVCLLWLGLLMLVWRYISIRPNYPKSMSSLEVGLAKGMHFLLYVSILLQPLSGIFMALFSGRSISVFGWFELPAFGTKNEVLASFAHQTHTIASFIIIGLVALHSLAALYHHFIRKDNVLRRMI